MTELVDRIRPGTSRGLDFVRLEQLAKRTGISKYQILKFAMLELLFNALDKLDATYIVVKIWREGVFDCLEVSDNGAVKFKITGIKLVLDFDNEASSKRGFLSVSRGYLGNALKCIFGYSYALAEESKLAPPADLLESGGLSCKVILKPNWIKCKIEHEELVPEKVEDDGTTKIRVRFPAKYSSQTDIAEVLKELVFATSLVNPSRRIHYEIFGQVGDLGQDDRQQRQVNVKQEEETSDRKGSKKRETSILWYTLDQFTSLFEDFVRAKPDATLRDFVLLFRGLTSNESVDRIVDCLNRSDDGADHPPSSTSTSAVAAASEPTNDTVAQFFPGSKISEIPKGCFPRLFYSMRKGSKPVSKRSIPVVLGCVGREAFEQVQRRNNWYSMKYWVETSNCVECPFLNCPGIGGECSYPNHVEFPFLVEIVVFHRSENVVFGGGDGRGLKVYQCINFSASTDDVLSKHFNLDYRLGRVGIMESSQLTIVVHLVSPVLKWLNYGKSSLG